MTNREAIEEIVNAYMEMQDAVMPPPIRLWCIKCADAGIKVIEHTWDILAKAANLPLSTNELAPLLTRIGFLIVREGLKRTEALKNNASPHN